MLVEVPVLKALTYRGRSYVRGEIIALEPVEALALSQRGAVTLTRGAQVTVKVVEEPKRRGRYRRADLRAER